MRLISDHGVLPAADKLVRRPGTGFGNAGWQCWGVRLETDQHAGHERKIIWQYAATGLQLAVQIQVRQELLFQCRFGFQLFQKFGFGVVG